MNETRNKVRVKRLLIQRIANVLPQYLHHVKPCLNVDKKQNIILMLKFWTLNDYKR